jgi:uncharacterized delta-60 repeat protein
MTVNSAPTFKIGNGKVSYDIGFPTTQIQSDGKFITLSNVLVGPNTYFKVSRFDSFGLDTSFGNNGSFLYNPNIAGTYGSSTGFAIQSDDKILLSIIDGVVRYNSNGTLDVNFGSGGILTGSTFFQRISAFDIYTDSNGKYLVYGRNQDTSGGSYGSLVIGRFNNDGTLDNTFGNLGISNLFINPSFDATRGSKLSIQPDGKILIIGQGSPFDFWLTRLNSDGSIDSNFGNGGFVRQLYTLQTQCNLIQCSHTFKELHYGYPNNKSTALSRRR